VATVASRAEYFHFPSLDVRSANRSYLASFIVGGFP